MGKEDTPPANSAIYGVPLSVWGERGDRVHAASRETFISGDPKGRFREDEDASLFMTGFPAPVYNGADAVGEPKDLDGLIRRTTEFCSGSGLPWSITLPDGYALLKSESLSSKGFREIERVPALLLPSLDRERPPLPPGLSIRRARTPAELGIFLVTMAKGSGFPAGVLRNLYREEALKKMVSDPKAAWFVGFADGLPVATSLRIAFGDISYIAMVATVPRYRKRGFGEALTWRATLSGEEAGCKVGILRASKMGEPIYRKMGFIDIGGHCTLAAPGNGFGKQLRAIFWLLGVVLWFQVRGSKIRKARWTSTEA